MGEVVPRALEELPPRQRVVVALRDLDRHAADEVSELDGSTQVTRAGHPLYVYAHEDP